MKNIYLIYSFICVEVLQRSQPIRVKSSTVTLPNYTFTGQDKSSKRLKAPYS